MGLFSFLGNKKPSRETVPEYKPSQYDAPSAKILFDQYSSRAQGIGTGLPDEAISNMNATAIDTAAGAQREAQRVAGASPYTSRRTGGVTPGSAPAAQERAVNLGLTLKSQALRDIGLRSAILKYQDQIDALGGLQGFLSGERGQANQLHTNDLYSFEHNNAVNEAIRKFKEEQTKGWINLGETALFG